MKANSISVIIPTYNRTHDLLRAIDSAINQTLRPDEIIVVDDNSKFDVQSFLKKHYDYKIKVIRNTINLGPAESRNIGTRASSSEFIAFLDSDDYWDKNKLKKQKKKFDEDENIGLVYCNQWIVKTDQTIKKSSKKIISKNFLTHLLDWWTAPNPSTLMFKKRIFWKIGGFDSSLKNCEDHDLWMRIAINKINVIGIDEPLAYFNMENPNDRLSLHFEKRFDGMQKFLSKWKFMIIEHKGRSHFEWFKSIYYKNASYPILLILIKNKQLAKAFFIFRTYLLFNKQFYLHIFNIIICRLRKIPV